MSEIFHSLVLNRRFDDATLRVLESALVSKDVKSSIEVRSGLRQFLRSESLSVLREISEKSAREKLLVLEFLVRSFALVGDSCLALRYEALLLRDLKSATNPWLQVPYTEWLNFAHQSKDSGFYSVAGRACENALVCFKRKFQAQTADYLKKRLKEKSMDCSSVCKDTKSVASTLFRNGIKKRNLRKLNESRSLSRMTDGS
ncbi:uncharacterized protein Pyn_40444 [Prunus yedoensis var. nudiflora]|uniref:Uncharacterized protein n=1 Tax=Prunus yedoensis var. nudiflora TaxID=2094558 RepID=A0A314YJK8_PRUYE|nr:uncharacterized protein Pyn_40444 [Prunus yedoensis var. nudiflora]